MNGVYNMNFSAGNARELIDGRFLEHEKLVHRVMGSKKLMKDLEDAAGLMKMTLLSGNKIMFCGNGGSGLPDDDGPDLQSGPIYKTSYKLGDDFQKYLEDNNISIRDRSAC